jgi:hypothetical protein
LLISIARQGQSRCWKSRPAAKDTKPKGFPT